MIIKTTATTTDPSDFEASQTSGALRLFKPRNPLADTFSPALTEGGEVPFEDEEALLEEALLEEEAAGEDEDEEH